MKPSTRVAVLAGAAAAFLAAPALSQTGLLVPTSKGRPDATVLSLREMAVDVGIGRGYARINLRQVFENHTGDVQEGTWRFRLPESGAVGDFAVWDGLTRIPGVILEKRRARAIYRELTTQRIDPGLLQQGEEEDREPDASGRPSQRPSGGALFSVKVAPIPGWGTKRLEMQYQQEVPWASGVGELRIPLRPDDGEPMTAGTLEVRVTLLDGTFEALPASALPLTPKGSEASFSGKAVKLSRDVVVRFRPPSGKPLAFSAFRSPDGHLPDGLALAPWERPSDVPPEKDGFFLLEYCPGARGASKGPAAAGPEAGGPPRKPLTVAILFDTSLSTRWGSLEAGYAFLGRLLSKLSPEDRFVLIPYDQNAAPQPTGVALASDASRTAALEYLRGRPLAPGTRTRAAIEKAVALLPAAGQPGRLVLITDGREFGSNLGKAAGRHPLFAILTGDERPEAVTAVASGVLSIPPGAPADPTAEETLFFQQLFAANGAAEPSPRRRATERLPFTVSGGDPKVRDVYGVMSQPPVAGSLSGWVGRYGAPIGKATVAFTAAAAAPSLGVSFPEKALDARDLPRRWARARVDDLLARIELEGERREWVEEILELSRRYKFVTPYTAFLAAPRSLLRPRRIQPGDPVIRVEADPGIVSVAALLPFGRRVDLVKRPKSSLWEGRFLVPEGLADGRLPVRLILRDASGAFISETKHLVIDGTAPTIRPELPADAAGGASCRVGARADSDVVFLSARLADGPPIPLRWDAARKLSTAELSLPAGLTGDLPLFFEAIDGAGNHGFARATLRVR